MGPVSFDLVPSCALYCQTMMSSKVRPRSAGRRRTDPSFTMSITDPQERSCEFDILDREVWWSQTGSNRRPHACKARALPTELWPHIGAVSGELGRCPSPYQARIPRGW